MQISYAIVLHAMHSVCLACVVCCIQCLHSLHYTLYTRNFVGNNYHVVRPTVLKELYSNVNLCITIVVTPIMVFCGKITVAQ